MKKTNTVEFLSIISSLKEELSTMLQESEGYDADLSSSDDGSPHWRIRKELSNKLSEVYDKGDELFVLLIEAEGTLNKLLWKERQRLSFKTFNNEIVPLITHDEFMIENMDRGWGNGYVAVPQGHPLYNIPYENIDIDVHGGLTYSNMITKQHYDELAKHNVVTPDLLKYWLLGFDTGHHGDTAAEWTKEKVIAETQKMAELIKAGQYEVIHDENMCKNCNGTGYAYNGSSGDKEERCITCNGTGYTFI